MKPKARWTKHSYKPGTWYAIARGGFGMQANPTEWIIWGRGVPDQSGRGSELVDNMLAAEAALTEHLQGLLTLQP